MRLRYFILAILLAPLYARADVVINEIAWMGMQPKVGETIGTAANNEWIELYNSGNATVSLEGWNIIAEDGSPDILLHGSIAAGGYFLLERTDDNTLPGVTADQIYTGSLGNNGEYLKIKNASGVVVDEINALSGWPAGDNTTKDTMQRSGSSWITASATPRAVNAGAVSVPPPSTIPSAIPEPSPISPPVPASQAGTSASFVPSIRAHGGEDIRIAAGTLAEFLGHAFNAKDENIENARFLWNFGDGETKEGRAVTHIYQVPGKYTVGLHIASGENAASHYHTVEVVSNQLTIGSVVQGEKGFIIFVNPAGQEIDMGGWLLDDGAGARFAVPPRTKIAAHSEVAFANQTTRLFLVNILYPVTLRFPNASIALQKFPPLAAPAPVFETFPKQIVPPAVAPQKREDKKIVPVSVPAETKENSVLSASSSTASSSAESHLVAVAEHSGKSSFFWFAAAIFISLAGALGFIAFSRSTRG